ncbi:hypothetical protein UFOVP1078_37 [uncultured Caudovirales phage]|uniref:Uncharacterized protein n=1 Tax=uncultured Caudovirales phage TaxID=2100421 RepID=A0A6J5RL99_9CAUD|nr:hypothetical protein UFOVP289_48 [uncultured Caudovirales phage]CAB4150111.1 hypothetical protein UFOVP547_62 [uncultured Caudovirales phage]CAB4169756.1 hypothetical protein UFOVP900_7 [uncultured Caudovirales phage]CAB4183030.1 hypothetical protein UFOVP1078_37 [uncultured Caudovirales phage]CAB4197719.1 hypothetical protein UFOVP1317_27 [uncultured Caudovirales phage]
MTKVHLQNKWAETNNSVCALLRQAHDVLALTSLPMEQVRKPLTDAEIYECYRSTFDIMLTDSGAQNTIKQFARAVERAHGIGVEDE